MEIPRSFSRLIARMSVRISSLAKGASGLVEDHDPGLVIDQGAGNLDKLAFGGAKIPDEGVARNVNGERVTQKVLGPPAHVPRVNSESGAVFLPHEHGFRDRKVRNELQFLVNETNTGLVNAGGRNRFDPAAVDCQSACLGRVDAGQHLDDRGFAGAVFADEAVYFTRRDRKACGV